VWVAVIAIGATFALRGTRPLQAIVFAQAANGLLLPIIAGFLLWVMNRPEIMGVAVNRWRSNLAGGLVVLFTAALGGSAVWRALVQ
jgi:Mn2+/Fe2+ NRAMP family transporter